MLQIIKKKIFKTHTNKNLTMHTSSLGPQKLFFQRQPKELQNEDKDITKKYNKKRKRTHKEISKKTKRKK
jgi:hypothetical protein